MNPPPADDQFAGGPVRIGVDTRSAAFPDRGTIGIKLAMIEQTATAIRFKLPPEAKPGRLAL